LYKTTLQLIEKLTTGLLSRPFKLTHVNKKREIYYYSCMA